MSWITTITFEDSDGQLKDIYDRIRAPDGYIDNILLAHSLRPHTLEGHMGLYKSVLHHARNDLPKSLLELLGVYVSMLNDCEYCVEHHARGLRRLLDDDNRTDTWLAALANNDWAVFDSRTCAALDYARSLTREPSSTNAAMIDVMRANGLDDGQILEINQVCAYFAYANRTVLGLGVSLDGDILGLSPGDSDNPDNWSHA